MNKELVIKSLKDTVVLGMLVIAVIALICGFIYVVANTTPWLFMVIPIGLLYLACYLDNKAKLKREGKL